MGVGLMAASPGVGRTCRERARGSQSADGGLRNTIRTRKIGLHCALGKFFHQLAALVCREFMRPTEANAASFGSFPAFACAGTNEFAFELGKTPEHREHQAAMRRGGVGPS